MTDDALPSAEEAGVTDDALPSAEEAGVTDDALPSAEGAAGVTAKPRGVITRGTTNPNRLRRMDNWIAARLGARLAAPMNRWWSIWVSVPARSPPSTCVGG